MDRIIAILKQHYADVRVYRHPDTGQTCIYIVEKGTTYALIVQNFNGIKIHLTGGT
jgi:hypothetical protein